MTAVSESFYGGGFILRELPGLASRDGARLLNLSGVALSAPAGLVLSAAPATPGIPAPLGTNAGNGTVAVSGSAAVAGFYVVNLASPTTFTVSDFSGVEIAHGTVGAPVTAGGLTITVTAGSAAFAAGDGFTIPTAAPDGTYIPFTGAQPAAAILFDRAWVDPGAARRVTVLARNVEVNSGEVQWDPTVTTALNASVIQTAAMASLRRAGILFRPVPVVGF